MAKQVDGAEQAAHLSVALYGAMRLLLRPSTRAYRGFLDFAFGSPCLVGVKQGYAEGVPMGGDLPAAKGKAPTFILWAVKDPDEANLDRIQRERS